MAEKGIVVAIPNDGKYYDIQALAGFTFGTGDYLIQNISVVDAYFVEADNTITGNENRGVLLQQGVQYMYQKDPDFPKVYVKGGTLTVVQS